MNFFLDENLSRGYGKLLTAFERRNTIECHHVCFKPGTPDPDWLRVLGERRVKPVVVCGDGRILSNKAELAALKGAGLTFVCLRSGWTNMNWHEQAWKMIKCWPDIGKNVDNVRSPSVFDVTTHGKISLRNLLRDL